MRSVRRALSPRRHGWTARSPFQTAWTAQTGGSTNRRQAPGVGSLAVCRAKEADSECELRTRAVRGGRPVAMAACWRAARRSCRPIANLGQATGGVAPRANRPALKDGVNVGCRYATTDRFAGACDIRRQTVASADMGAWRLRRGSWAGSLVVRIRRARGNVSLLASVRIANLREIRSRCWR